MPGIYLTVGLYLVQVIFGTVLLSLGTVFSSFAVAMCCCLFKFARSFARHGDGNAPSRPKTAVGGALYDVSAKYGKWFPGGANAAHPGAQVGPVPLGPVHKPPKTGYGGDSPQSGSSLYGTQPQYGAAMAHNAPGSPTYGAPAAQPYGSPQPVYGPAPSESGYSSGLNGYRAPQQQYGLLGYAASPQHPGYGPQSYGPPGYGSPPAYPAPM